MAAFSFSYSFIFFIIFINYSSAVLPPDLLQRVHQKFEFKYSFKPPVLVNARGQIPFWDHGGDALATDEQVRVCPSIQERHGWVWSKHRYDNPDWMFDAIFSISGRNTYGADGMAFWFTSEKGSSGNMFGNVETFKGLSVVIDTFDNNGQGDSPKVAVYLSDGTLQYNHGTDGDKQEAGYCLREVRNKKFPIQLKVIYYQKKLEVWIHEGNSNLTDDHDLCMRLEGVTKIPPSGYFGISAATGGLSDDHDVLSYVVHTLTPLENLRGKKMEELDKAHNDRLKEYQTFSEKFDEQHKPTTEQGKKEDWQVRLELEENVRLVHDMQSSIVRDMKQLTAKVDQIIFGRQGAGVGGVSEDKMVAMEGRLNHHFQELKSHLTSGTAGKATASEQMQPLYEVKENVKNLQESINQLKVSIEEVRSNRCPGAVASTSCLSTGFFIFIVLIQSVFVIAFLLFKYNQEKRAKKFF